MWTGEERLNYAEGFVKFRGEDLRLEVWQRAYLADKSKYCIVLKSRRTGFSFVSALKALVKAQDAARTGYECYFVSYRQEDAQEKIRYAREFYHSIPNRCKKRLISETTTSMEFEDAGGKTSSRIISLPCRPPRGGGGDLVFDEMAIYPPRQVHDIYIGGLPVISRGGCITIGSTPLGSVGDFCDIYKNVSQFANYRRYTVPWWFSAALVCDGGSDKARLARMAQAARECPEMESADRVAKFGSESLRTAFESMDLDSFQQEFECAFIDSSQSFLPLDLIFSCVDESLECAKTVDELIAAYEPETHGKLSVGFDVARRRDASVIFVLGTLADGRRRSCAEIVMRDKDFDYQRAQMRRILDCLPVSRACIDRTGIGEDTCETLQKEYGTAKIEGVLFTAQSKEEMAIKAKCGLERREFVLHNDRSFTRQLHSIKRSEGSGGRFRYDAERNEDGHADSFWAWALANLAATDDKGKSAFYSQVAEAKKSGGGRQRPVSRARMVDKMIFGKK